MAQTLKELIMGKIWPNKTIKSLDRLPSGITNVKWSLFVSVTDSSMSVPLFSSSPAWRDFRGRHSRRTTPGRADTAAPASAEEAATEGARQRSHCRRTPSGHWDLQKREKMSEWRGKGETKRITHLNECFLLHSALRLVSTPLPNSHSEVHVSPFKVACLKWGSTLRSNGKCSNEKAIMDNDLVGYDLNG